MKPLFPARSFLSALAALGLAAAAAGATAQVRYFDHVPTPAQVRAALSRPAAAPKASMRRKGIEWNTAVAAEPADAPQRDAPAVALPVTFDRGAATVSKASMAYVDSIAAVLSEDRSLRLVIEGHTDTTGNPRANAMLSWERAFSVFRVLVERHGIDPQRLQPLGKGDSDPLRPAEPAHAINRRVQFRMAGTLPA